MTMRSTAIGAAAGIAVLALSLPAAAEGWKMDQGHTQVLFEAGHLGFTTGHGGFKEISGSVDLDEDNPESTAVDITISAASLYTWNEKLDEHLRSDDFFHVEKFPTLTFKSTKVERTGDDTARMTGDLTMLGVTKPVTLDVTLNKKGPHPFDKERTVAGFSATGTVKRSEFGMDYGVPAVGDEVKIAIETELNKGGKKKSE